MAAVKRIEAGSGRAAGRLGSGRDGGRRSTPPLVAQGASNQRSDEVASFITPIVAHSGAQLILAPCP